MIIDPSEETSQPGVSFCKKVSIKKNLFGQRGPKFDFYQERLNSQKKNNKTNTETNQI